MAKSKKTTKATKAAAPAAAPAEKSRPQRTPQNPFEHTEETLYTVEKIMNMRWSRGSREYLVRWESYDESHDTWEPMENLVGCAAQIREYELQREQEDAAAKAEVLAKRQKVKDEAAAEQAALRQRAAEAAAVAAGDDAADAGSGKADDPTGQDGILSRHLTKKGAVWEAYDLSVEKPTCKLFKPNCRGICGVAPAPSAGTTNYWSHLWSHHRSTWYELKRKDGQLNAAGEAELAKLKEGLAKMEAAGASLTYDGRGSQFLSAKLPAAEKSTMDRVTAEWVVDELQPFNAASTQGFRRMMATATSGKYDGCDHHTCLIFTTVSGSTWLCSLGGAKLIVYYVPCN